ncbi:hypothetical protein SCP_0108720 [Sparassis crispa]|uniref:Cupin 2 conserved barrel domain-containing protein n=1 Tax=Sparassis crispa TaxID=139825 RepID=A0A401G747_9APHY|nr:hypothetical protein SCP_0108720 [Sparassis crispa]GBE77990.1 hypothetical protein SCP_0108720 [Sparassis crispa]
MVAEQSPLPDLLRVVTGHNDKGLAMIRSEDRISSKGSIAFPGVMSGAIWVTDSMPVNDNNDQADGADKTPNGDLGIVMRSGTNFRYTDLAPGATAAPHRTASLDYNVLIQGKLILILEDGTDRTFETPGDVVVQRGTIHGWKNPGPEWTRWITILVDARPPVVDGHALPFEVRLPSAA